MAYEHLPVLTAPHTAPVHSDITPLSRAPQSPHQHPKNSNAESPCAVPLPGMLPKELKTGTEANAVTQMLVAALFTTARRGKHRVPLGP